MQVERNKQAILAENDPILTRITVLLGDNIGDPYDEATLTKIHVEGALRYAADPQVPPGYKDKDKKGNEVYGDLLVWKQTIERAKMDKRPILMINNEQKPDWIETVGGSKKPRKELVDEMYREAQVPFFMYTLTQFMEAAQHYLSASFSDTAISDASRVELEDRRDIASDAEISFDTLRSAFLLTWQEVERFYGESLGFVVTGTMAPVQALDTLRAQGYISDHDHNRLVWLARTRKKIVDNAQNLPKKEDLRSQLAELQEIVEGLPFLEGLTDHISVVAVSNFLSRYYPSAEINTQRDRPNIFIQQGIKHIAVDVVYVEAINMNTVRDLNKAWELKNFFAGGSSVDRLVLLIVGRDQDVAVEALQIVLSRYQPQITQKDVWTGYLNGGEFLPIQNNFLQYPLF